MKTIIAGSRNINDFELLVEVISESGFTITEVFNGCSKGVDLLGKMWANMNDIPVLSFEADWDEYGRGAGPIRNEEMAKNADALILIWDGKSPGSTNMLDRAKKHNLIIYIKKVK